MSRESDVTNPQNRQGAALNYDTICFLYSSSLVAGPAVEAATVMHRRIPFGFLPSAKKRGEPVLGFDLASGSKRISESSATSLTVLAMPVICSVNGEYSLC